MYILKSIIKKEFLYISRDKRSLFLGIISPIIFLLLFNYFVSYMIKDVSDYEEAIYLVKLILLMIFTMIVFLAILTGALEIGVGEKERGTLCSVLRTGINFKMLYWGKYITLVIQGIITLIVLNIAVFSFSQLPNSSLAQVLDYEKFLKKDYMINIILLVCIFLFSALELMISFWVRSFKEGQVVSILLMFLVLIPFYIVMFFRKKLTMQLIYYVPLLNIPLLLSDIAGNEFSYLNFTVFIGINIFIVFIVTKVIRFIISQESSLVRR